MLKTLATVLYEAHRGGTSPARYLRHLLSGCGLRRGGQLQSQATASRGASMEVELLRMPSELLSSTITQGMSTQLSSGGSGSAGAGPRLDSGSGAAAGGTGLGNSLDLSAIRVERAGRLGGGRRLKSSSFATVTK